MGWIHRCKSRRNVKAWRLLHTHCLSLYLPQTCDKAADLKTNQVRLAAVTQFLEGSFSFDGGQLPYLYCDDTFASPAEWDQPARDAAGNTIDNKDGGLVTLSQLYPTTVKTEAQAFYNTLLRGYKVISLLDPNGVLYSGAPFASICGKPGLQGLTSSAQSLNPSPVLINTDGDTFTASPMRRHMLICSSQFSGGKMPPATSSHAVGSLASIVESANYPTADSARGLDSYTTQGATLYHELFHLTDTEASPTADPYGTHLLFILLFILLQLAALLGSKFKSLLLMVLTNVSRLAGCYPYRVQKGCSRHGEQPRVIRYVCVRLIPLAECTHRQHKNHVYGR